MRIIAPSLLAADFLHLGETCKMLSKSKAEWLHLDVMDGRFVTNISFGVPVIEQLRQYSNLVFDVHLMIVEPHLYIPIFSGIGADQICIHYEACPHLHRDIQQIKKFGKKAGIALNPHTPVAVLEDIIQDIDFVNLMSVNPGFGGQQLIPQTFKKIHDLKNLAIAKGVSIHIEVDGGVDLSNSKQLFDAGATVLIAGSTVFRSNNPIATIEQLLMS